MSDDVIISVEHLSKRYRLGQIGATTLRESAERFWHRLRGRDPAEHMGQIGVGCRLSTVDCKKESANPQPDKNIQSTTHNPHLSVHSPQPTAHTPPTSGPSATSVSPAARTSTSMAQYSACANARSIPSSTKSSPFPKLNASSTP